MAELSAPRNAAGRQWTSPIGGRFRASTAAKNKKRAQTVDDDRLRSIWSHIVTPDNRSGMTNDVPSAAIKSARALYGDKLVATGAVAAGGAGRYRAGDIVAIDLAI